MSSDGTQAHAGALVERPAGGGDVTVGAAGAGNATVGATGAGDVTVGAAGAGDATAGASGGGSLRRRLDLSTHFPWTHMSAPEHSALAVQDAPSAAPLDCARATCGIAPVATSTARPIPQPALRRSSMRPLLEPSLGANPHHAPKAVTEESQNQLN